MHPVDARSPDGVPAQLQGGTPSPLPAGRSADALETIEFGPVLELIAAHAVGPLGAARIRDPPAQRRHHLDSSRAGSGCPGGRFVPPGRPPAGGTDPRRIRCTGSPANPGQCTGGRRACGAPARVCRSPCGSRRSPASPRGRTACSRANPQPSRQDPGAEARAVGRCRWQLARFREPSSGYREKKRSSGPANACFAVWTPCSGDWMPDRPRPMPPSPCEATAT